MMASNNSSLDDLERRMKQMKMNFPDKKRQSSPKTLGLNANSPLGSRKARFALTQQQPIVTLPQNKGPSVNLRFQEMMNQNGKLLIKGKIYNAKESDFTNLGEIGAGTCGQVFKKCFNPAGEIMAVKEMLLSGNEEETKRILMDLDVVQKSNFPQIVQCYGTLVTESHVWVCMELMSACFDKLMKKIKGPVPEAVLGKLASSVVNALNYLKEQHGIIHRDVKPSNILIDQNGTIKLCDFGISGRLVDSKANTRSAGCVAYMSPERIDPPDPTKPDYDIRADVWSLGVSLVELAMGTFPYPNCTTDFEVLTKVLQSEPPKLPSNGNFSPAFREFVQLCCTKNVFKRPKYKELLQHPFILNPKNSTVDTAAWLRSVPNIKATHSNDPFTPFNVTPQIPSSTKPDTFFQDFSFESNSSGWTTFDA